LGVATVAFLVDLVAASLTLDRVLCAGGAFGRWIWAVRWSELGLRLVLVRGLVTICAVLGVVVVMFPPSEQLSPPSEVPAPPSELLLAL
jgi:hypothetical protein